MEALPPAPLIPLFTASATVKDVLSKEMNVWQGRRTLCDVAIKGVNDDSDPRGRHIGLRNRWKWRENGGRNWLFWLNLLSFCIWRCGFWLSEVFFLSLSRETHSVVLVEKITFQLRGYNGVFGPAFKMKYSYPAWDGGKGPAKQVCWQGLSATGGLRTHQYKWVTLVDRLDGGRTVA